MAVPVAAIHFPEAASDWRGLWKMDHRDKPGDDDYEDRSNKRMK
jgi:hypothetical protein